MTDNIICDHCKNPVNTEEHNIIIKIDEGIPTQYHEKCYLDKHEKFNAYTDPDLPETVNCPECGTETAEQVGNGQLWKCKDCGRETVRIR